MNCPICKADNLNSLGKNPTFINSNIFECKTCQLAFTYPLPTLEDLAKFYKPGFYDKGDIKKFKTELNQNFSQVLRKYVPDHRASSQFQFIYPFLSDAQQKTALDIGCSSGSLLTLLIDNGFCVTGYEPDDKMALLSSKRLEGNCENKVFPRMIEPEDFKQNSLDLICSSHVLEHISDPVSHLSLIRKSLKEGGILFMEIPNEYSLGIAKVIDKNINSACEEQGHLYYYSPNSLKVLLNHCGFDVLLMETCGMNVKSYLPVKSFNHKGMYNALRIMTRLAEAFSGALSPLTKTSSVQFASLYEHYHKNDQQGVWIRLVATPQS